MDSELKHQTRAVDNLKAKLHTANTSMHTLQQRLYRSNEKVKTTGIEKTELALNLECEFTTKVDELQHKIELLVTEVDLARHERDILSERLGDIEANTVRTKHGQKFIDGVRQCCIELLSMNVATKQVEPVIRSVLRNIASIEVGELPKPSTLSGMLAEMKCLAYQQALQLTVEEVVRNLLLTLVLPSQSLSTTPFIASQEGLIGKRIHHKWKDSNGTEQWYYGKILSLVPGTSDWFNVKYDNEEAILSLNLFVDIDKGDLNILD